MKTEIIKTDRFISYVLYEPTKETLSGLCVKNKFNYFFQPERYYQWINTKIRDKFYLKRLERI